jgi:uncharacterized protein (TIGR03032 family)
MTQEKKVEFFPSTHFNRWMFEQKVSLCFSTYQAGKLFFIGLNERQQLSIFERSFARCMGISVDTDNQSLWLASQYQMWRFENALQKNQSHNGYDKVYVPQVGYTTGAVDAHDVVITNHGVVFVNTLFNCIAKVSDKYSFEPIWQPPHIKQLVAEDRCHLNGLALLDGELSHVTCVSQSNENDGWRKHRMYGGVVIDVKNNQYVAEGLSMPHSPRWYRGKLWLLNSGTGEFGYINFSTGKFEAVVFCNGFLRGLSFSGDYAIVGLSKARKSKVFEGLEIQQKLADKQVDAMCGFKVINLKTGNIEHELTIEGVVRELYDVCILAGVTRPMAIGFQTDEIKQIISLPL